MADHRVNGSQADDVATRVRSKLEATIGSERAELWIGSDTTWQFSDGVLTLGFVTDYESQLCRRMLASELNNAVAEVVGDSRCEIRFDVRRDAEKILQQRATDNGQVNVPATSSTRSPTPQIATDSILLGDSNEMAMAAMNIAIAQPGRVSPIALHGPTGCGKSLFLSTIARQLRGRHGIKRVIALTSEQFTNDFTESLRGGGLPMFRRKYRDVDAMMLDDIQFFVGKRSTISEVRYTIDNLVQAGKQVVLTMDRPLSELAGLGDELLGRLRGGLVAPMMPIDAQIRQGLLQKLASEAGLKIVPQVLDQLAQRLVGDGRLVRGVVNRLIATAAVQPGSISWDQCWAAVHDLIHSNQPIVRLTDIERTVCGIFGLQESSLQSSSKIRSISAPRMVAMYLARKYTPAAYKEIGEYFGRRRHSTVISAEKSVETWIKDNSRVEGAQQLTIRDVIRQVEAQLKVG